MVFIKAVLPSEVERGDMVRHIDFPDDDAVEVWGVHGRFLWTSEGSVNSAGGRIVLASYWRKVAPRFEVGHIYQDRSDGDCDGDYEVKVVAVNEQGNAIGFYANGATWGATGHMRSDYTEVAR